MPIERPVDRLKREYQSYLDNISEWKKYKVKLFKGEELVIESTLLAYNREHLMIEIGHGYKLEELSINRIEYKLEEK